MKVILLRDVKNLGKKLEVREVPAGYARNFLIPRVLAEPATQAALDKLAKLKEHLDKEENETIKHLESLAKKINGTTLIFDVKIDPSGHLFGSVSKEMIQKAIRDRGLVTKERVEIKVDHPLKNIGDHQLEIDLKKGIKANLKITLRSQP